MAIAEMIQQNDFVLLLPKSAPKIAALFISKLGDRKGAIIEGDDAYKVIKLYSLYEFSDKIIVGSFDEPYGRKLRNLLDCGVATEDEIINDVILGAL